jgi:hypothetical protein
VEQAASQAERVAGILESYRGQFNPLASQVMSVVGGSAQQVDRDMTELLRAASASLDRAIADLHTAAREIRMAAEEEYRLQAERQRAAERDGGGGNVGRW